MQILIEIPDNYKELLDEGYTSDNIIFALQDAVVEGTPLPEHYGRLIDAEKLKRDWVDVFDTHYGDDASDLFKVSIDKAPTIIPATKEGDGE